MKKLFYLLLILPMLALVACEPKEPTPDPDPEQEEVDPYEAIVGEYQVEAAVANFGGMKMDVLALASLDDATLAMIGIPKEAAETIVSSIKAMDLSFTAERVMKLVYDKSLDNLTEPTTFSGEFVFGEDNKTFTATLVPEMPVIENMPAEDPDVVEPQVEALPINGRFENNKVYIVWAEEDNVDMELVFAPKK